MVVEELAFVADHVHTHIFYIVYHRLVGSLVVAQQQVGRTITSPFEKYRPVVHVNLEHVRQVVGDYGVGKVIGIRRHIHLGGHFADPETMVQPVANHPVGREFIVDRIQRLVARKVGPPKPWIGKIQFGMVTGKQGDLAVIGICRNLDILLNNGGHDSSVGVLDDSREGSLFNRRGKIARIHKQVQPGAGVIDAYFGRNGRIGQPGVARNMQQDIAGEAHHGIGRLRVPIHPVVSQVVAVHGLRDLHLDVVRGTACLYQVGDVDVIRTHRPDKLRLIRFEVRHPFQAAGSF